MGIKEDTGITGNQFSLIATIFYISFICCEFPTGYLMQRLPLSKYLGANIILWGIVIAANAGTLGRLCRSSTPFSCLPAKSRNILQVPAIGRL